MEDFREILFETISPVKCLVTVACNFKVSVVDFIPDGGDVGEFDVGYGLFEHFIFKSKNSFIIVLILFIIIVLVSRYYEPFMIK